MRRHTRSAMLSALVAFLISAALFIALPGAIAVQGQAVIAGQTNTETSATVLHQGSCTWHTTSGVAGCSPERGVEGFGGTIGVQGATNTGTGVRGVSFGSTGIGVSGETGGSGSGVYGKATGSGIGVRVFGDTASGIGVQARATSGTAVVVQGKAKFSRSGIATFAAGTSSKVVTLGGVTAASMVFATAQQNAAVFVKSVVPVGGSFTIRLTGNAPAGGLKIAWFVLN